MNEMKKQWETTLREREEQLAKAHEEIEVIPAAACDYQTYTHDNRGPASSSSSNLKNILEKLAKHSARPIALRLRPLYRKSTRTLTTTWHENGHSKKRSCVKNWPNARKSRRERQTKR
jgi:hypothetical protein